MRTSNRIEPQVAADSFSNKRHYTRDISLKDANVDGEEAAKMEKEFRQISVKKSADIPCEARWIRDRADITLQTTATNYNL